MTDALHQKLDLDAVAWADLADVAGQDVAGLIEKTLETVLVFSNAHLALRHENHLAIYAALSGRRCAPSSFMTAAR